MSLVDVGGVEDLEEGASRTVEVEGRQIVLTRWHGAVFAMRNICPHQAQSLMGGYVVPGLSGLPESLEIDETQPAMVCPVHKWTFDLATGKCLVDRRMRIRRYDVHERDGRLLLDIGRTATSVEPAITE